MKKQIMVALTVLTVLCTAATALINPNFTLKDVYDQSDQILVLEFTKVTEDGKMIAKVTKVLKGDADKAPKEMTLDVMGNMAEHQKAAGENVLNVVKSGHKQAVVFIGTYMIVSPEGHGGDPMEAALLNLGHQPFSKFQWAIFTEYEGELEMDRQPGPELLATFNGSTDMVIKAVEYIRDDPEAHLPVTEGVTWDKEIKVGQVEGKASEMMAVDIAGDGKVSMFVASLGGDKLFQWNGKAFDDITAKHGLSSKSAQVAWGDFNGDKRLDLASWTGKEVVIHTQGADGKFSPLPATSGETIKTSLSLAAIGGPAKDRASLVVSTPEAPVMLTVAEDGSLKCAALPAGKRDALNEPAASLVADFDGDNLTDVLQLFANGSLFYKGQGEGKFADPVVTQASKGPGIYATCLGDYDHDGLLDIVSVAEDRSRMFQNNGEAKFEEMIDLSGEISYISKPDGISCATADFNNDGRQDVVIGYKRMHPLLFFNRGFRSFGHARDVDLSMLGMLQAAHNGQSAVAMGDFNGSGALDMAMALENGEIWLAPRKMQGPGLAVTAMLAADGPVKGPVVVTAKRFERSLGAMIVRPGEATAFYGTNEPGPITLSWQLPGGERQTEEIILEDKPARLVIKK